MRQHTLRFFTQLLLERRVRNESRLHPVGAEYNARPSDLGPSDDANTHGWGIIVIHLY